MTVNANARNWLLFVLAAINRVINKIIAYDKFL